MLGGILVEAIRPIKWIQLSGQSLRKAHFSRIRLISSLPLIGFFDKSDLVLSDCCPCP